MSNSQDCRFTSLRCASLLFLARARGQHRPSIGTGGTGNGRGGWEGSLWNIRGPQQPSPAGPFGGKTGGGSQGGEEDICHSLDGAGS